MSTNQVKVGWRAFSSPVVSGTDTDAQAFITAAGITNTTQQSAINTLVTQLKTYGIWTKMKALYPFVGGSASSHKFNLKDPRDLNAAFRLTFYGGGIHSSTGYQLNGSNSWGDANLVPSSVLTNNNVSIGFYSRTNRAGANRVVMGTYDSAINSSLIIYPRYTDNKAYFQLSDDGNGNILTVTSTLGFFQGARNNSSTQSLSNINGTNYSFTYTSKQLPTTPFYVGSIGYYSAQYVDSLELAFAYVGENLSATDLSNYYTAVQTFQTTLGRQVGVPIVADADAQAFLNAAIITDQTQASAVNTLVTDLKSANIWSKMKALYPFVGGTAASHKFNLKDPRDLDAAYRLVFNGGWTHTSTGALPNGTTGYANTFLNPISTLTNLSHLSFYSRTDSTNALMLGVQDDTIGGGAQMYLAGNKTTDAYSCSNTDASIISVSSTSTTGMYIVSRTATASLKAYKNGINVGSHVSASFGALPNIPIFLGGFNYRNMGGASTFYYANKECAFSSVGNGLTDAEAANFYTAVQKYQTTLGRQVGVPIVADADAQAFLNAAVITDSTQASAVNTLVVDLKSANIWTKMKALYPMVGGTATTHKFNLKDPRDLDAAYRLVFNGGWIHTGTGALPNGTTGYADTKLVPSSTLTNYSSHLSFYSRTNRGTNRLSASIGSYLSPNEISLRFNFMVSGSQNNSSMSAQYDGSGLDFATYVTSTTNYFLIGNRTANNINKVYENGILKSTNTITTTKVLPSARVLIGALSDGNANVIWYDNLESAFASIGDGLTDAEAAAFYTAVQKYQTSLGRQV
jgi:hypothetical protein